MAKIDSEDDLKRHMRRRLVGAVALVTALVIILPTMLEKSPNPNGGKLELRIPDKDKAGAFTTQMVVAESAPAVSAEPASDVPPGAAQAASSPASAVPAAPAKPATAKPEPAKPPKKDAAHKPEPAHKPATPEHRDGGAKAGFAVQVGAFSHAEAARDLQDKLRKQGWHVYTRKSGETIRVRVGAYPTRDEAERVQRKLKAQGQEPVVVTEP